MPKTILTSQDLVEQASPAAPSSGVLRFYAKSDHKIYTQDSTGAETQVGAGSGGSKGFGFFLA
jgi:hypothetical protein